MNLTENNLISRSHFICYGIAIICIIAIPFTGPWEAGFHKAIDYFFKYPPSIKVSLLFITNASLLISISLRLKDEDERVEKIKNYARVHIFFLTIFNFMMIGLFCPIPTLFLVWLVLIQIYYIVIYWICIYRDPSMLYMNAKQKAKTFSRKEIRKINFISGTITFIVFVGLGLIFRQHQKELSVIMLLSMTFVSEFVRNIYAHLKY
jgi:hypothetical protein